MHPRSQPGKRQMTYIGTATQSAGTITYHANTKPGDILVVIAWGDTAITAIGGAWTTVKNQAGAAHSVAAFVRIAGTESSVTSPHTANGSSVIAVYRHVNGPSVPSLGTVGAAVENNTDPIAATAITPQCSLSTVIAACVDKGVVANTTPGLPTGYTNIVSGQISGGGYMVRIADKLYGSSASTGTASFSQDATNSNAIAFIFEIRT